MIPVMQTKLSSEDGSVRGNCMAACVASLLEIGVDEVPAWDEMGTEWIDSFEEFLILRGYDYEGSLSGWRFTEVGNWANVLELSSGVDGYFMVAGPSPRAPQRRRHAVIYKDGVMVHDPHPDGTGVTVIGDIYLIERKD